MSLKKLATLLAVSVFALSACGSGDNGTDSEADTGSETEETTESTGESSKDLIEKAKEESGDADLEYGITFYGTWTTDGYEIEGGEITGSVVTDQEEYYIYLVKDGKIIDKISSTGGENAEALPDFAFTVEAPAEGKDEYIAGISGEDLGEVGADISEEDLYRYEKILVLPASEEAPAEE